jgi:hypothetical protein
MQACWLASQCIGWGLSTWPTLQELEKLFQRWPASQLLPMQLPFQHRPAGLLRLCYHHCSGLLPALARWLATANAGPFQHNPAGLLQPLQLPSTSSLAGVLLQSLVANQPSSTGLQLANEGKTVFGFHMFEQNSYMQKNSVLV